MPVGKSIGDVNRQCGGSVTTEDGVLLRENAEHTHPPSQVQAQVDRVVSYLSGLSYLVCASVTDS